MALIDDVLTTINATLTANLPWLDNAFGKIQRMRRKSPDGKDSVFPGVYVGPNQDDYRSVLPDDTLGNYSFFEIKDPVEYKSVNRTLTVDFEFKLVFWFHWPDLYADYPSRSIEEVKAQILNVLMAGQFTRSMDCFNVYEDANSIFQNFTNQGYISAYDHKQIRGQFLMKPYGAIAISGNLRSFPTCFPEVAAPTIPSYIFGIFPANYNTIEQVYANLTWFGQKIWWRTWAMGNGSGDWETLSGITESDMGQHVLAEARGINAITGDPLHWTPEIKKDGTGFKAFIPDYANNVFITWLYTR